MAKYEGDKGYNSKGYKSKKYRLGGGIRNL